MLFSASNENKSFSQKKGQMIDLIVKCVYKAFHRNIFTKLIYNLYCKKRYINKGDLT